MRDDEHYESFYVRPHQVGNPDSVQYNPVFNGVASWQLYHDDGFWAAIDFPIGEWFTVRLVFAGTRAEVFVDDMASPALEVAELKMPVVAGGVGIQIGGPGLLVSRFAYGDAAPAVRRRSRRRRSRRCPGIVPAWLGLGRVRGAGVAARGSWRRTPLAGRTWTRARRRAVRARQPRDRQRDPRRPGHGLGAHDDPGRERAASSRCTSASATARSST